MGKGRKKLPVSPASPPGAREYTEMSALFSAVCGTLGCASLREWTERMDGIVRELERAAQDPSADLSALAPRFSQMGACIAKAQANLAEVMNSCTRFCSALREPATAACARDRRGRRPRGRQGPAGGGR